MVALSKKFVGSMVVASLVLIGACSQKRNRQPTTPQFGGGGSEWLSWTPAERNRYVYGYLSGYGVGFHRACESAENLDLLKENLPPRQGEENVIDISQHRCLDGRKEYSKVRMDPTIHPDVSFYSEMITKLYQEHPDSRSALYEMLMELMSDGQVTNSEALYHAQAGKWPNARVP